MVRTAFVRPSRRTLPRRQSAQIRLNQQVAGIFTGDLLHDSIYCALAEFCGCPLGFAAFSLYCSRVRLSARLALLH